MSKKIGIISMQRVVNHGSFLQAYALKRTIEQLVDGTECEFIDHPQTKNVLPQKETVLNKLRYQYHRILKHQAYCADYESFVNQQKYMACYTDALKKYLNVTDELNLRTDYETVLIGSDEVFNCTQEDTPWKGEMFLFGDGVKSSNIICYAASFGYTTIERLQQWGLEKTVGDCLLRLSAISVRDINSRNVVKCLTGITPVCNVDPVLIYDFSDEVMIPKRDNYIVIYEYTDRITEPHIIESVKKYAKKKRYKIISVFGYCSWADENLVMEPFSALGYIKHAECVVTDTFHGCVMSIKYNKRFVALSRESNKNKLEDLLLRFGLEQQLTNCNEDIESVLNAYIDWDGVNKKIEEEKIAAQVYLSKSIAR